MAISVVCSGCQSQYNVPDNMAGKRAKCKKCGSMLAVPLAAGVGATGSFDDLEGSSTPAPQPMPLPKPKPLPKPASAIDSSLDDIMSLEASAAPSPLAAPVHYRPQPFKQSYSPQQGRSGASIAAAIAATLLSLCCTTVVFFSLFCTTDYLVAFIVGGLGVAAAIGCCALGIARKPGLSWSVFALYGAVCILGVGKAGYNVYRAPSKLREFAEKQRREMEQRNRPVWTPPPRPSQSTSSNTNNTPGSPSSPSWTPPARNSKPWSPSTSPEDLKQPRTDDWKVTTDAPADWAKVGEGRDFNLVLDEPSYNPIKHANGYARAVGFQHQLGGKDIFEVWDLGTRKKIGQLKGKNGFEREFCLSPDGKFVAGEVRADSGSFQGPIQVWSIAAAEMVCEIAAPSNDRDVEILDFAAPGTLMAVFRRGDVSLLKLWNISDGTEKQTIDLGEDRIDRRHYAWSPGRKYFVLYTDQVIRFFNLATGATEGTIYLPRSFRCEALTFSPDGAEFAALCNADFKSRMLVWQTATGEVKSQLPLDQSVHDLISHDEKTGGMPIGWLSNGEGWLFGGKKVLSRKDGKQLWSLPQSSYDHPGKLLDADQLIGADRIGSSLKVSMRGFPFGEMDSVNKALAAGGTALDAKLIPLGKPDTTQIKELTWTSGVSWGIAPDPRPAIKPGTGNRPLTLTTERLQGILFAAPSQGQAVVLDVDERSPEHGELSPMVVSFLSRFDLASSKAVVRHKVSGGSALAAISPSGRRAALTIGSDVGRVDVYSLADKGQHLCAWRPFVDENSKVESHSHQKQLSRQSIQWAGFVDEDHLLTMNHFDGQLILWKVPEMRAIYRLRTGADSGAVLSPTGKYVLVRAPDRFALLEAKTGQLRGELPIPVQELRKNENLMASFSADGARLVAAVPDISGAFLLSYDLALGKEIARMPLGYGGAMQWCGPRQLLVGGEKSMGGMVRLVDLDRRAIVWRYHVFSGYRLDHSPDDRVWLIAGGNSNSEAVLVAQPFQLTNEVTTAIGTLPFNPPPLFGPGTLVSIDTAGVGSAGSPDLATKTKEIWTTHITARGARVGEGGLKVMASTTSGASRTEEYGPARFGGFPFPGRASPSSTQGTFSFTTTDINLQVQLVDAAGQKLWEIKSVASYYMPSSIQSRSDEKTPQQILADGQTAAHRSGVDNFFLGVRLPYMIYPQPVDKDGIPGLGSTMINLSSYVRDESRSRPATNVSAGAKDAAQSMYTKVLTENSDPSNSNWQWCQGLERPVMAIRWGLGVQMDVRSEQAKVELLPEVADASRIRGLDRVAGPIGPTLVQMLRAKQSEGKFGTFADTGDDNLREVILLGSGERAQLARAARKGAVDIVLIIKLEPIVKGRQRDAQLSLEVLDMASGKKLWASEGLLESRVKMAKAVDRDLLGELADNFGAQIDDKLALSPLENMPSGTAAARAELPVVHRANPLAAIAEIDLYLCREQIPVPTAIAAFGRILSDSADAAALASEDIKTREAAIEKVVPLLLQKIQ